MNPFQVVKDFEHALCEYTGAPYAVTTTSCTAALLLAVAWHLKQRPMTATEAAGRLADRDWRQPIEIPKRTYVGVPMSIIHAGGRPTFREQAWVGKYQLHPLPIWDCARMFTSGMYHDITAGEVAWRDRTNKHGKMQAISFHHTKILGLAAHGGAILHDDPEADKWLRMARFDGRQEGVAPKDQTEWIHGWHCYMTPPTAAEGLLRLASLPRHNTPLPNDNYPDLSTLEIFK